MSVIRQGSMEKVRIFAYAQLSSYLQRTSNEMTMKELSLISGVNYNSLIMIKNMKQRSISVNKLMDVMVKVGMDYSITMIHKNGKEEVKMEIDQVIYRPQSPKVVEAANFMQDVKERGIRPAVNTNFLN